MSSSTSGCGAEEVGLDSVMRPATTCNPGATRVGTLPTPDLPDRDRRAHHAGGARHECPDTHLPLQPRRPRPGARHPHTAQPAGRIVLGIGSGEALNEISVGLRECRVQGTLGTHARGRTPDARAVGRRTGDLRRRLLPHGPPTMDDPSRRWRVDYVAAGGPQMAKYAGRVGDGFICTSGKGMDLYTGCLPPASRGPVLPAGSSSDDIVRRWRSRCPTHARGGAGEHPLLGPALLECEEKHRLDDPVRTAPAANRRPIEQVSSAERGATTPEGATPHARCGRRLRPPSVPRVRAPTTEPVPWASVPMWCGSYASSPERRPSRGARAVGSSACRLAPSETSRSAPSASA